MNFFSVIKFIVNHPLNKNHKLLAATRFLKWQVGQWLVPFPIIYTFTNKAKLIIAKGHTGATGNYYCGLHEYNDMFFLLHFLRPTDHFVDVGANIGSYTVLAAAHVGAATTCFEPSPTTFLALQNNIAINHIAHMVLSLNQGVGSKKETLLFTTSMDTMNHVATTNSQHNIEIETVPLDDVLLNKQIPQLIKMDVEGFETEVIKGATNTLQNPALKAIIIELNGSGSRYGYDEAWIHQKLTQYGFVPHHYNPITRGLQASPSFGNHNTIYVRDMPFVQARLQAAAPVCVLRQMV